MVSLIVEDEPSMIVFSRKNCLPKTNQDQNGNSKLKHPQSNNGKLDSLRLLKTTSLVFYLIKSSVLM